MTKKIAILTGGGDCPGLNSVLRAVVKTAVLKYDCQVVGYRDGFKGVVLNEYLPLTPATVSGIISKGGTILGSSNRDNPFNFKSILPNGETKYQDLSDRAIKNMHALGIESLIVIGGDGSLKIAGEFAAKGVKIIGVPKTIDNDLAATNMTFGFMTAIDTATEAIDKLHTTAESHHRIMVLEVMGRYAGWIALYAGLAGGADVILIPEIPFDLNIVAQKIISRKEAGKNFSIVVVAEGAKEINGELSVSKVIKDSPDQIRLGGIGNRVGSELETLTGMETRVTVLGHLQRGGYPSPYDRILSTRYGVAAAELAINNQYNVMVSLQGNSIVTVPLSAATGAIRNVPTDGELVVIAKSLGISFGA